MTLLLLLTATGCGFFDRVFGRDELTVLHRNQGRWRALAISDYDFDFRRQCFCGNTQPVRVAVRAGSIANVTNTSTGQTIAPGPYERWPTIDSLFVWSERSIRSDYKLDITYDGAFHFPARVSGDLPRAIDDEYTVTATGLVRIPK